MLLCVFRDVRQNSARLSHRFHHQHARHHRTLGEMTWKERLVDGHVLDGCQRHTFGVVEHPINQQERVAVRKYLQHLVDV
jgi:hypothetical protein